MSSSASLQVVHESETQRQHVRLAIPGRIHINGKEGALRNLSAGGAAIDNVSGDFKPGAPVKIDIHLPFEGFALSTRFDAEVRHFSPASKLLGCRFINPTPRQISFLTHVLKSFIAGEVVSAGNILNVAARNNYAKARPPASRGNSGGILRQIPGLMLVATLGALLIFFIGSNLYNSIFVVRSSDAVVTGPAVAMRAPASGALRLKLDPGLAIVKQGQTLGTITPASGQPVTLQSPCNCYITKTLIADGENASAGDRILALTPLDAAPWITANVDPAQGMKIKPAGKTIVSVFGSSAKYTGRVDTVESQLTGGERGATMKILLDQKLPIDFINRPASVDFSTH